MEAIESNINSVRERLAPLRRKHVRFAIVLGLVIAATLGTAISQWLFGTVAASLFALAVVAGTALLGLVPGILAAVCAALALDFFYSSPPFEWKLPPDSLRVGCVMLAITALTHLVERRISAVLRSRVKPLLGVFNHLDGIQNGVISGWAFDADHPQTPAGVTFFLNGQPVAYTTAVHYRPDVAESMKCSGQYGFYVDLAEHFRAEVDVVIHARLANGSLLEGSPVVVRPEPIARPMKRPPILFMHIPKTAGTALREAIASNFLLSEIAYIYPGPPGFLVSDLRLLPLEQRRAYRVVIGHFQVGMHEALPERGEYITMIREPGARVLSQYRYLQQTERGSAGGISLEELLEKHLTVDYDNLIVRCFSGVDERIFRPGTLTSDIYDQAVLNLRTLFRFVGHQEHAMEAYEWLSKYYGWHSLETLPSVNLGIVNMAENEKSKLIEVIRYYNKWDFLFYEELQRLFPKPGPAAIDSPASLASHS